MVYSQRRSSPLPPGYAFFTRGYYGDFGVVGTGTECSYAVKHSCRFECCYVIRTHKKHVLSMKLYQKSQHSKLGTCNVTQVSHTKNEFQKLFIMDERSCSCTFHKWKVHVLSFSTVYFFLFFVIVVTNAVSAKISGPGQFQVNLVKVLKPWLNPTCTGRLSMMLMAWCNKSGCSCW